jgi:hypothetical protein
VALLFCSALSSEISAVDLSSTYKDNNFFLEMTIWANINLQDRSSLIIEQLISFHDHALIILLIIITVVAYIIITLALNKYTNRYILEGQIIEVAWTLAPAIVLLFIAVTYCIIASGPCQSSHSWVEVPKNSRLYFTVSSETPPTWRARSPYLYPPGTGWPNYTPRELGSLFVASYGGGILTRLHTGQLSQHTVLRHVLH